MVISVMNFRRCSRARDGQHAELMRLLDDRDVGDGTESEFGTSLERAGNVRSGKYCACTDAGVWEVCYEVANNLRGGRGSEGDLNGAKAAVKSGLSGEEGLSGVGHADTENNGGGADSVKGCIEGVCKGVGEVDGWGRLENHCCGDEFST